MLHRLTLALLLLTGCFRNHGAGGDDRDGGRAMDGGAGPWRDCYEADVFGREGDPCDFEGACFGDGPCTSSTNRCLDGRVDVQRTTDPTCPTSCADLEGLELTTTHRCEVDFGTCTLALDECCVGSFRCEGGFVRQVGATACDSDCGETGVCESWAPPPPEGVPCTADSDCDSAATEYCLPPGESPACPVCSPDERSCLSDADCPDGTHCAEYEPVCPPCDGIAPTTCFENCVPGGCPDGETCTPGGGCTPLRCESGAVECPDNHRCTGGGDDGCARLACERDSDCDCGSCISGLCYDGPGVCRRPSP